MTKRSRALATNDTEVAYWLPRLRTAADAVTASLETARDRAIDLGRQLIEAKAKLPHGEFGRLFADHASPVDGALTFTARWGQRIMLIAENPAIANTNHGSHLPSDLNAVAELAMMSAPALEAAIDAGKVRPDMTRAEAKALKNEVKAKVTVVEAEREPPPPDRNKVWDEVRTKCEVFIKWSSEVVNQHPWTIGTFKAAVLAVSNMIAQREEELE